MNNINSILEMHNNGSTIDEIIIKLNNGMKYMDVYHILNYRGIKINQKQPWFVKHLDEIKNMIDNGYTYKEIGRKFNKQAFNILTVAKKYGWKSKNKQKISNDEKNKIIELYKSGYTFTEIEHITGRCDTSIGEIIASIGIITNCAKIRNLNKSLLRENKRFCGGCQTIKYLDLFHGKICKECDQKYAKKRYYKNNHIDPNFTTTIKLKYKDTKSRARYRNIDFSINLEDIINQYNLQNGLCYYTKQQLGLFKNKYDLLSIDRIDSNKGYTKDNIVLCLYIINVMKNQLTTEEFLKYCNLVVNNYKI